MLSDEIPGLIREAMIEKGLIYKDVAKGTHYSLSYISEVARGQKVGSIQCVETILNFLDIELHALPKE